MKLVRQVGTPSGAPLDVSSIQNLPELAVSPKETDSHRNRGNPEMGMIGIEREQIFRRANGEHLLEMTNCLHDETAGDEKFRLFVRRCEFILAE